MIVYDIRLRYSSNLLRLLVRNYPDKPSGKCRGEPEENTDVRYLDTMFYMHNHLSAVAAGILHASSSQCVYPQTFLRFEQKVSLLKIFWSFDIANTNQHEAIRLLFHSLDIQLAYRGSKIKRGGTCQPVKSYLSDPSIDLQHIYTVMSQRSESYFNIGYTTWGILEKLMVCLFFLQKPLGSAQIKKIQQMKLSTKYTKSSYT